VRKWESGRGWPSTDVSRFRRPSSLSRPFTPPAGARALGREVVRADFVVAGGGMAGIFAAAAAARRGLDAVLVQDRPVLGGNASKEVRVSLSGNEGGANARWFRETGMMEELKLENLRRNPGGTGEGWDAVLLDWTLAHRRLRLFLNTAVTDVAMRGRRIAAVEGVQLAAERRLRFEAPYFADCTGDGTVGYLAGAAFMAGSESRRTFGESMAPRRWRPFHMGASILFLSKDTGRPVEFVRPAWVKRLRERDLAHRGHAHEHRGGDFFWWVERGGDLDSIRDNERVKFELLDIVYGIWDHFKNHPNHREAARNHDLEWVGTVPGKRESRRLVGDHVLRQDDLVGRADFPDAVATGGWSIDDHPHRGFRSRRPPSSHFYLPGIYNIPLRSLYSREVGNLFFAGRNLSASHLAMCSTRVMVTCAQMGEAVGAAAAMAVLRRTTPRAIATGPLVRELQQDLLRHDHDIVGVSNDDRADLARLALASASSEAPGELPRGSRWHAPDRDLALMFPAAAFPVRSLSLTARVRRPARLRWTLRAPDPRGFFLPGRVLRAGRTAPLARGTRRVDLPLALDGGPGLYWLEIGRAPGVELRTTREGLPGILTHARGPQRGTDYNWWNDFSPWAPLRVNLSYRVDPAQPAFPAAAAVNGWSRPFRAPNLWISKRGMPQWLRLDWPAPRRLSMVQLRFDTDLDVHLRNLWAEYPYKTMRSCVKDYRVEALTARGWKTVAAVTGNYHRLREHRLGVTARALRLVVLATNGAPRAHLYEVRVS